MLKQLHKAMFKCVLFQFVHYVKHQLLVEPGYLIVFLDDVWKTGASVGGARTAFLALVDSNKLLRPTSLNNYFFSIQELLNGVYKAPGEKITLNSQLNIEFDWRINNNKSPYALEAL